MSYASDYDDFEQSSQGECPDEHPIEAFCWDFYGRGLGELSNSERAQLEWHFKLEQKGLK